MIRKTSRLALRLLTWSLPIAVVAGLLVAVERVEERATLAEVGPLLVAGDGDAARELLEPLRDLPRLAPEVDAALAVAAVLDGRRPEVVDLAPAVRAAAPPLALVARAAFERGDFRGALRVAELAGRLGRPAVPVVTAAALIESGRSAEARRLLPASAELPGQLALRVGHHLQDDGEPDAVLLRDRDGHFLGTARDGELALVDPVRPELVPRAVAEVVAQHPGAGSVRLSLDLELADAAYRAFGRYYRGSIVLVDPRSGEILAAVSDRRSHARGGTPAFEQRREPASISKLITTTAALRAGIDPDAELAGKYCRGHRRYDGKFLYCASIAGPLRGLDRALAVSCNVAFADLGVAVGRAGMLRELRRYGFDRPLGPFPGGRIVEARGDDRQLADLSIGLEATEITPLHAALLAAVMANRGVMPAPTLVLAEDGRLGFHPRRPPHHPGRRVIDEEWLPEILGAMEAVVEKGTARRIAPSNFPVAMKTGTASHPRYGFHVNYVGIGPHPGARIAFCVRITDQPTSRKVRTAARAVTRRLLRNLGEVAEQRGWLDNPLPEEIHRPSEPPPAYRVAGWDRDLEPLPLPTASVSAR